MPAPQPDPARPFWQTKSLAAMDPAEWESLCDGCGKCCLHKLEDIDTGELFYTNVACRLLDLTTARCTRYAERLKWVPDCVHLSAETIHSYRWLPATCAYRLLAEGRELPAWHPLISGDPASARRAGASIRGWTVSEREVRNLEAHLIPWQP